MAAISSGRKSLSPPEYTQPSCSLSYSSKHKRKGPCYVIVRAKKCKHVGLASLVHNRHVNYCSNGTIQPLSPLAQGIHQCRLWSPKTGSALCSSDSELHHVRQIIQSSVCTRKWDTAAGKLDHPMLLDPLGHLWLWSTPLMAYLRPGKGKKHTLMPHRKLIF